MPLGQVLGMGGEACPPEGSEEEGPCGIWWCGGLGADCRALTHSAGASLGVGQPPPHTGEQGLKTPIQVCAPRGTDT